MIAQWLMLMLLPLLLLLLLLLLLMLLLRLLLCVNIVYLWIGGLPFAIRRLSYVVYRFSLPESSNDLPCSTNTGLKGTQSHLKCTMPLFVVYLSHSMPFLWIFITRNQFYFPFSKLDDSCTQFLLSLSHSHAPSLSQSHTNKTQIKIFLRIIHAERPTSQNLYLSVFFVRCCCCCFFFRGYKNFNMENIAENPKKKQPKTQLEIYKYFKMLKSA